MVKGKLLTTISNNMCGRGLSPRRIEQEELEHRYTDPFEYSSSEDEEEYDFPAIWCENDYGCLKRRDAPESAETSPTGFTVEQIQMPCTDARTSTSSKRSPRKLKSALRQSKIKGTAESDPESSPVAIEEVWDPPNIKRSNTASTVEELEDVEEFPAPTWQEDGQVIIANDFFNHSTSNAFETDMGIIPKKLDFDSLEDRGYCSDETTVVVSNQKAISEECEDTSMSAGRVPTRKQKKIANETHESLADIFQISLSKPFRLPAEKKRFTGFRRLIRRSSVEAPESRTETKDLTDNLVRNSSFKDAQESILLGVPLESNKKSTYSPQRIGNLLKSNSFNGRSGSGGTKGKTAFARRHSSPAKILEDQLNKKQNRRRVYSDSNSTIKAILKRKKGVRRSKQFKPNLHLGEWKKLDDAVRGRLDGVDVISCGSTRQVSYIGQKQTKLSGQRYTLRNMVLDSFWCVSSSNQTSKEIVLEGYIPRGQGNDRWTTRVGRSCSNLQRTHLWGKGNNAPPAFTAQIDDRDRSGKKSVRVDNMFVLPTVEEMQLANEYAAAPLEHGQVAESIKLFQKLLRSLEPRYKKCKSSYHVIGSMCHNIAILLSHEGRFEDALNYINKAISIRVQTLGISHSSVAVSQAKLGIIYFALERLDSSLRAFNQALSIRQKINDKEDIESAKILQNIGIVRFHQGEKRNSLNYLIDALKIQRQWIEGSVCRESTVFDTSITLSNMAKIYLTRSDYVMAAYLYEESLQLQTSVFQKDHHVVLETLGNIAFSKAMAGEKTNALQIYKSLLKLQTDKLGLECREAVETNGLMGVLYIQQSNYTVALRCLSEVAKWQQSNFDEHHPALKNTRETIKKLELTINRR